MKVGRVSSVLDGLLPRRRMRRDWDRRAREDARRFIACGHAESDAKFWASGKWDLENLVLHDVILDPRARVLEIGCGIGRLLRPLSDRVEKVFGVDISGEMVARAREALADRPNVEVLATRGDLEAFSEASLDFVYSFIVFQHIPAKRAVARYIREAARVLKGGGVLRFQVDGRPRPSLSRTDTWLGVWYEPEELRRELAANGFEEADLWGEGTHYLWVTAARRRAARRPDTGAIRVERRSWRRDALEVLLARLGVDPATEAEAVLQGERSLRQAAERFLERHREAPPAEFVRRAYEAILGREADPEGLAFYTKEIAGGIPPSNAVDCLLASAELEERLRPVTSPGPRGQ